ncbi:hypothetical protein G6F59_015570 [Rhizopus arrhizus]|nr:hypothetical protein G6F59_015570 [Rhizopus arrhizus]
MGPLRPRADGSWQASGDPGLPALVGLWRPRIVVGPAFDQQFSAQEQDLILQHERSHRRNGDHWANGALLLMRTVFWFHPLLPWAARPCAARPLRQHAAESAAGPSGCARGLPLAQPTRVEGAYRHVEAVQAEGIAVGVGPGAGDRGVPGDGSGGVGQPGRYGGSAEDRGRAV